MDNPQSPRREGIYPPRARGEVAFVSYQGYYPVYIRLALNPPSGFSLSISPEFNSGSKHRSLGWMPSNNAYIVWHLLYPKSFIHLPKYYSAPSRHQNPFGNTYKIEFKCQFCKKNTKICIFLQKYLRN